jgi:hypothetical protein
MSRNNDLLKLEMTKMVASVQKKGDNGTELGRWIPAKVANIEEKLISVIDWFDGVP